MGYQTDSVGRKTFTFDHALVEQDCDMVPNTIVHLGLLILLALLCSTNVLASNSSTSKVDLPIEPLAHFISSMSGNNQRCIKVLFGTVPLMQNHFGSMQQTTVADKLWPALWCWSGEPKPTSTKEAYWN